MNWTVLAVVLISWSAFGLFVAYSFGRFIRGVDTPDIPEGLVPSVVSYLRRGKRVKNVTQLRAAAQPKRRASSG